MLCRSLASKVVRPPGVTPGIRRRSTRRWNRFGESEPIAGNSGETLYTALTCPNAIFPFTAAEGAVDHGEMEARARFSQRVLDWLDETLSGS